MSSLRIITARSKAAVKEFIDCAYRIRGVDPRWIGQLRRDVAVMLDRMKHPFHEHAECEYFLARRGRETVGRMSVCENFAHNAFHEEKVGFFGFLEAVDDPEVFRELLRAGETWARRRGLTALRGPASFSTNEECGLLVEGYDADPFIMLQWHPPFYKSHVEAAGYQRAEDLLGYWLDRHTFAKKVARLADAVVKRMERKGTKIVIRTLDMSRFDEEVDLVKRLYNKAWEKNWGFVPMTDAEITFMAKELKPIVHPKLVYFAEVDGETAGFCLNLPDYNVILKHMDGRLDPKTITLALLMKNRVRSLRVMMLGLLPEFRNRGIDVLFYHQLAIESLPLNIHCGELSWVLDDHNKMMNRVIESTGARLYKRWRIYEKPLSPQK